MHKLILILILGISCSLSWGHGGEDHSEMKKDSQPVVSGDDELKQKYIQINKLYIKTVRPIFKKSCFDCHGNTTNYPWYYKIPGVKQLIDHDIEESKKHLDFSNDFPFVSHETPLKDFEAIGKTIKDGSMPPLRYRIMHGDSKITEDDIKQVEKWIKESREILK